MFRVDEQEADRQTGDGGTDDLTVACSRQGWEDGDLAVRVFELSQALQERWVTADIPEKRQLLEIICLNFQLVGASLVPEMRKPFDVIAKGLFLADGSGSGT